MREQLEVFRLWAIGQLEQEQQQRAAKLRQLKQEATELENANGPAINRVLRAQKTVPMGACPRCWIWDGEQNPLESVSGTDDVDIFKCRCGHVLETPIT